MYTEGIRKIYTCRNITLKLHMIKSMAEAAGYNALTFNGHVFVRIESDDFNGWLQTCFHITDFQDVQV